MNFNKELNKVLNDLLVDGKHIDSSMTHDKISALAEHNKKVLARTKQAISTLFIELVEKQGTLIPNGVYIDRETLINEIKGESDEL